MLYLSKTTKPQAQVEPGIFPKGSGWNEDNYGPLIYPRKVTRCQLTREIMNSGKYLWKEKVMISALDGENVIVDGKPCQTVNTKSSRDYYFMMGDQQKQLSLTAVSGDLCPMITLSVKHFLIYWSWDPSISFFDFFKLMDSVRWDRIGMPIH